jgi:hypothetical protein
MHALLDVKEHDDYVDKDERLYQGGYNANKIMQLLDGGSATIVLDGGGSNTPYYPDSLKELIKDLYVPIGLFTQIKPCSSRSYEHNGKCITDAMFNELNNLTSIVYKTASTRKQSIDAKPRKTRKNTL